MQYRSWLLAFFSSLLCGLVAFPVEAGSIGSRLQALLADANLTTHGPILRYGLVPVIVTFADQVDVNSIDNPDKHQRRALIIRALKQQSRESQRSLVEFLHRQGINDVKSLWLLNGIASTVPVSLVTKIAALPGVAEIRLDYKIKAPATSVSPTATPEWNLVAVKAPELWARGVSGSGVVVANMDTGVDVTHPDLATRYRGGDNSWYDPNGEHNTPADPTIGHGTETMGIMVGGSAGGSAIGVAPDAKWIAVKIFDDSGSATNSVIHQGYQWLLDPDGNPATDDAADVVNNSWGYDARHVCNTEFQTDIEVLKVAGIAVVFSAGNNGPGPSSSESPANNVNGFAVGAVGQGSTPGSYPIASFSSRGPSECDGTVFPEVVAPGVATRTSNNSGGYSNPNGTSFSAPHVSGVLALLLSAFPNTPVADLEQALEDTAMDLGTTGPDNDYGYGLVNALAAYNALCTSSTGIDSDGDGIPDVCDNCTLAPNGPTIPDAGGNSQRDTDGDGYGNMCDADLDQNGTVNVFDYGIFRTSYGTTDANSDFNGDGTVNVFDYGIFRTMYGQPLGPSCCGVPLP